MAILQSMINGGGVNDEFKEVRCPSCKRLLFKIEGLGCIVEIICPKCKVMSRWPILAAEIVSKK